MSPCPTHQHVTTLPPLLVSSQFSRSSACCGLVVSGRAAIRTDWSPTTWCSHTVAQTALSVRVANHNYRNSEPNFLQLLFDFKNFITKIYLRLKNTEIFIKTFRQLYFHTNRKLFKSKLPSTIGFEPCC